MSSDLRHLDYSHGCGMWQLLAMLMCIFPNSKSIGSYAYMLPSRRMNGRNDQEEQWNRMRSVCTLWCDKFTAVSVIHNGRPRRCAVPPWAWDSGTALRDSAFLSIYLSPICLPVCLCSPSKLRCRSHTNANSGTRYMRASIWTPARNQHFSLCSYPLLPALMYLCPRSPSGHILFARPVEVPT